jgi:hypothetical protein
MTVVIATKMKDMLPPRIRFTIANGLFAFRNPAHSGALTAYPVRLSLKGLGPVIYECPLCGMEGFLLPKDWGDERKRGYCDGMMFGISGDPPPVKYRSKIQ